MVCHTQQTIKTTSTQDLDPRPLASNDHPSVLPFEMYALESGEPPSRTLNWKSLGWVGNPKGLWEAMEKELGLEVAETE